MDSLVSFPSSDVIATLANEYASAHQKRLLPTLDSVLEDALRRHSTPDGVFAEWFQVHHVDGRWQDHEAALQRLCSSFPNAPRGEVWTCIIRAEIQNLSEQDAKRSIERRLRQQSSLSPSPTPLSIQPREMETAHLQSASADSILERKEVQAHPRRVDPFASEMKDWLLSLLGPSASDDINALSPALKEHLDFLNNVDPENLPLALRDGYVPLIVVQRMKHPTLPLHSLVLPKRLNGFFARDNLSQFLTAIQQLFPHMSSFVPTLPDPSDFLDGSRHRAVITFLFNVARAAARCDSFSGPIPEILRQEKALDEAPPISDAEVQIAMGGVDSIPASQEPEPHQEPLGEQPSKPALTSIPLTTILTSPMEPQKPDSVVSHTEILDAVDKLSQTADSRALRYVPIPEDSIDVSVGEAVNRVLYCPGTAAAAPSSLRFQRLARKGAYVLYNTTTKKKVVVHVRIVKDTAVVRIGGGWDDFEDWLRRHETHRLL